MQGRGRWSGTARGSQSSLLFTIETGCWRQGDISYVASVKAGRIFSCRAVAAICCFGRRDLVVKACSLLLFIVGVELLVRERSSRS